MTTRPLAAPRAETPADATSPVPRRQRILLVTPVSPANVSSGSGQRTALMLEALETCGPVDVLHLMPGAALHVGAAATGPALPGGGRLVEAFAPEKPLVGRYRPQPALTRAVEGALGRTLADYDVVVGRYAWGVCQLEVPAGVRIVADLDDFRYRYGPQAPWSLETLKERARKWMAHALLRRQLHRFDSVFFVSPLDQREQPQVASVLLPNIPFAIPPLAAPRTATTKNVLFVGSLWYRPNAEGIDWLLRHVWPRVRREVPDATLTLVGAAPAATREAWAAHPGVRAPGFVDDLAQAYADASLVVVPIHSGGGTNIKVLEALAYARPCLISSFTHRAFAEKLLCDQHVLVASDKKAFCEEIVRCLTIDQEKYVALGNAGYEQVTKAFQRHDFKCSVLTGLGIEDLNSMQYRG
jgi:glycosyltransferase involved in cell wall biosynthesis